MPFYQLTYGHRTEAVRLEDIGEFEEGGQGRGGRYPQVRHREVNTKERHQVNNTYYVIIVRHTGSTETQLQCESAELKIEAKHAGEAIQRAMTENPGWVAIRWGYFTTNVVTLEEQGLS